jgi:hypothetical protein
MARDEVGVEVGEDDMLNIEARFGGVFEVLVNVSLGVNDGGDASFLVPDEVGGVG